MPTLKVTPVIVPNSSGRNQFAQNRNAATNRTLAPSPTSSRPRNASAYVGARPNASAPRLIAAVPAVAIARTPYRSVSRPAGI